MSALAQAVLGLEQLLEDGVVEGLRAQQPDVEGDAPGRLAGLAGLHGRRGPTTGSSSRPGPASRALGSPPRRRPWCWPSRCSGSRPRPGSPPGCAATAGNGLPGACRRPRGTTPERRRCSRGRGTRSGWPRPGRRPGPCSRTSGLVARARMMSLLTPAISSGSRSRPKRKVSISGSQARNRGQARVQLVQPRSPWPQSPGPPSLSRWNGL